MISYSARFCGNLSSIVIGKYCTQTFHIVKLINILSSIYQQLRKQVIPEKKMSFEA